MTTATMDKQTFSIFGTFFWVFTLSFGAQMLIGIFLGLGMGISGMEEESINNTLQSPMFMGIISVAAAILTIPLFKVAAFKSNKGFPFNFVGLKPINRLLLIKLLAAGFIFFSLQELLLNVLNIAEQQFMLDIKAQTHSALDVVMVIIAICLVAPIIEECVFRGIAYTRLVNSKAGVSGAIIITSLLFGLFHFQYEFTIMVVLTVWALLLGYVRYKTDNVIYCIALHMLNNIIATVQLFLFY